MARIWSVSAIRSIHSNGTWHNTGDCMVKIVILGQPRVKKNGQRTVQNRYTNKPIRVDTKAYKAWHGSALNQLQLMGYNIGFSLVNAELKKYNQRPLEAQIDYPINLCCKFYIKRDIIVDLSALYEGIQDVLVEVGIISDDNSRIVRSHDGSGVFIDPENPRMEIEITPKKKEIV